MNDQSDSTNDAASGLLPAGLRDVLPPRAELEAQTTERLMAAFAASGYRRVKPPLVEYEETLLSGLGQALAGDTFRFMDTSSQRMLGIRPDITLQIARIAATRLRHEPRPLRLSYAGQVLRTRGGQLRPERQFAQAGFELIGSDAPAGDLEVALLATEAVLALGVGNLSLDVTNPLLVPALCDGLGFDPARTRAARLALDHKDAAALVDAAGPGYAGDVLKALLEVGPSRQVLARLGRFDLPPRAAALVAELRALCDGVTGALPDLLVTLDLGEFRGFEYHSGISFSLFARGVRGELGRGGRYVAGSGEPSTGCTLYLDSLMRALPAPEVAQEVLAPFGAPRDLLKRLRAEGWSVVQSLSPVADLAAEAKRLKIAHVLRGADIRPVA
jgi:ATP phosphoribosyltransferase regulatory subunit